MMSYIANNSQSMTEIVFTGRNKKYGAYVLRSCYAQTLLRSLSFVLTGCTACFLLAWYFSELPRSIQEIPAGQLPPEITRVIEFNSPPPEADIQPQPSEKAAPSPPPADNHAIVRVVDSVSTEVSQPLNDSAMTRQNDKPALAGGTTAESRNDGGDTKGKNGFAGGRPDTVNYDYQVDSAPEFEGGLKALNRFLADHLHYPSEARDEGKQGVVHVKFVVDESGQIRDVVTLNKVGYGMEEEALRVVATIPKFKAPARIKGRPVKVYYHIPIKFSFR